jgi:hypothetical protein
LPWTAFVAIYGSQSINKVCVREIKKYFSTETNRVEFFSRATLKWLKRVERFLPKFKFIADLKTLLNSAEKAIEFLHGIPNETTLKRLIGKREWIFPQMVRCTLMLIIILIYGCSAENNMISSW